MTAERPTVYIVDDDPYVLRGLVRVIRSADLNAVSFATADDFLQSGSETGNSCLVVDAKMPVIGGMDMLTRLRKEGVRIPAIVVSAHDDPKTRKEAEDAGAVAYFRKPVDSEALLDAITWALGSGKEKKHQKAEVIADT